MGIKTIGIFGGSFAPVHRGHMGVAAHVLKRGLVDEVWMMPCRRNPLKEEVAIGDEERLSLLEKAAEYTMSAENIPGKIKIDDLELHLPEPSYTWQTMERLGCTHKDVRFRLIIGADSYLGFDKWRNGEWLAENFNPIVFPRPGYEINDKKENFTFLENVDEYDVSSTSLREKFDNKEMPWLTDSGIG